jgi:hypothetical protein
MRQTRWPDWVGYAAAGWAALYGTIALIWTVTGDGFPFGRGNPDSIGLLRNLPASTGAPLFAAVLLATAVMALMMAGGARPTSPARATLFGFGALVAGALLVVVPEPDVLMVAGYAPVLLVGAPFGWPDVDYAEVFTWPLLNQVISIAGGFLVAGTVLAWRRRTREACGSCGRGGTAPVGWTTPAAAARWGRWAVYLAMAVPLSYAVTRYAWLLRIPLGADGEFIDELHADGAAWAGAWLATFGTIGAILTLGLVQRWGERFPRWTVGLAGRRVPMMLAMAPASVVSVMVISAGLSMLSQPKLFDWLGAGAWSLLPQALWPVWGAALAAATLAYYLRRRGRCSACGRPAELARGGEAGVGDTLCDQVR